MDMVEVKPKILRILQTESSISPLNLLWEKLMSWKYGWQCRPGRSV